MLLGSGLIFHRLTQNGHPRELGIHFSGIGLGIGVSALAVKAMSPWLSWRGQWLGFALLGCALLVPALRWLPVVVMRSPRGGHDPKLRDHPPRARFLAVFMAVYFCAGIGYVVSATFIVAIVSALPRLEGNGEFVFLCIGLGAAPAAMVWDLVVCRIGRLDALLAASTLQIVGILLPVCPADSDARFSARFSLAARLSA